MTDSSDIECPFCGEKAFDKIGLKYHLEYCCIEYGDTESLPCTEPY